MQLEILTGLAPEEYEHPRDTQALNALKNTKGIDTLVKKFYEYGVEKIFRILVTGSNLRVTQKSFPLVYYLYEQSKSVLNLEVKTELYFYQTDEMQGFTTGVDKPIITLSNGCVDSFTDKELLFIIGREVGHIKSAHVLYYELGTLLPLLSEVLGTFTLGIGSIISMGLRLALMEWQRMSEYTADRAGLLACQDIEAAASALSKISGLPSKHFGSYKTEEFIAQAKEFEGFDVGKYNKVMKYITLMLADQKWTVERANELFKWVDSGGYESVLNRVTKPKIESPKFKFCGKCKTRILSTSASFCPECGSRVD